MAKELVRRIELGDLARDNISGFEGIVIASTDWLYGCRRLSIQPQALHDGKPIESHTFDEQQCVRVKTAAVVADELLRMSGPQGPGPEPKVHRDPVR